MFARHPEDRLQLRLHRARSVILTQAELVEIRAAQRTYEGAYMRTALSQFSFSLVVLKIFSSEFYAIGALFAVYGVAVMLVAIYRRYEGNRQFFSTEEEIKVTEQAHDTHNTHDTRGTNHVHTTLGRSPSHHDHFQLSPRQRHPAQTSSEQGDTPAATAAALTAALTAAAATRTATATTTTYTITKKKFRTSRQQRLPASRPQSRGLHRPARPREPTSRLAGFADPFLR